MRILRQWGGEFSGGGAGIFLYGDELVYFGNVTVTDNTADFAGAGVKAFINGSGYFQNSTIAGNHNVFNGGVEVWGSSSSLTFINTIVASNDGSQCNIVGGTIYTNGRNISSDTSCGFTFKGDMQNTDPLLGPLGDNGGLTQTMALLSGSPAIDTGGNTICDFIYVGGVDQRGWTRPIDGDLDGSPICDIGAFEAPPPYQLWLPLIMR